MRDLQKDLAICDKATSGPWKSVRAAYEDCLVLNDDYSLSKHDIKFITASREGWPHAIERAIKAEAKFTECRKAAEVLQSEVERLTDLLDHYNVKCAICDYTTEITKLRKVAEAARDVVGFGACHDENSFWSIKALQNTVENYEGWKKEGER